MARTSKWQQWFGGKAKSRTAGGSRRKPSPGSRLGVDCLEDRRLMTASAATTYSVTNDWNSGFQAQLQVTNQQATGVSNWQLEFDLARNITSNWDARIVSHVGNHYVVAGAAWNSNLAAGASVAFGFVARGSGVGSNPTNYVLNGAPVGNPPIVVPTLSIGDVTKAEGNSGLTNFVFDVMLSAPATTSISVKYATANGAGNGAAAAGSDYQATSGTLTFAPGQTRLQVSVPVSGDTTVEPDEAFTVNLSAPSGATLAKAQATGTITNDDAPPSTVNFVFQVTSDWGSGFTGQITAKNTTTQALNNWKLEFDFAANITTIWNASITSHVGNHYVIQGASWNNSLAPGASVNFGFNGSPGGAIAAPSNFTWSGAGGPGGGTTYHAPAPAGESVFVLSGQAITINVLGNDTDADGDRLTVSSVTQPANGSTRINSDGTVTYTPRAGYAGSDNFSYTVSDGRGLTASAAVAMTVGAPTAPTTWDAQYYAPYVDMTLYPYYNIATAAQTQGIKYFSLGFITADTRKLPAWGGYTEYEISGTDFDLAVRQQVAAVRATGGDVMISFGGAANQELAEVITTVPQLTAAYQSVVDAYHLTHIDFDIEGGALAQRASVDRRSQAIAALQQAATAAGRPLEFSFTLPVLPTGLTPDGVYLLQSALRYGVQISGVNIMAMDYGDSAAPNPQGRMGDYAIGAATSLFNQLRPLYGTSQTDAQLWHLVGVTPMIGLNDVTTEVFDQAAARQLVTFAQQKGIGRISMWSLNRDTASTPKGYVDNTSSSISQTAFEFSQIFGAI